MMLDNYMSNLPIIGDAIGGVISDRQSLRVPGVLSSDLQNFFGLFNALMSEDTTSKTRKQRLKARRKKEERVKKWAKRTLQGLGYPAAIEEIPQVIQNLTEE